MSLCLFDLLQKWEDSAAYLEGASLFDKREGSGEQQGLGREAPVICHRGLQTGSCPTANTLSPCARAGGEAASPLGSCGRSMREEWENINS